MNPHSSEPKKIWCDNNPSATPESILHHWLNGVFIPDRSDEARYFASVGMTDGYTTPETMLWLSTVWQAIMDIENPQGKDKDMILFDALSWVLDESEEPGSFKFACGILGMEPKRAREKIVGSRKVKLPKKINTCPDCGVFIRENLRRCQECAGIAHAEQMINGRMRAAEIAGREYKRRLPATPEQLAERKERLRAYQREYQKKRRAYVLQYQRERREAQRRVRAA